MTDKPKPKPIEGQEAIELIKRINPVIGEALKAWSENSLYSLCSCYMFKDVHKKTVFCNPKIKSNIEGA
jgi:hypothetical protein